MKKILEIKNLSKTYQTPMEEIKAVDNFSLTLHEGEFVAIVGPSGCGKSTILSILNELEKQDDGIITKYNKKIGYMPQTDSLFEWRTIESNCLLGLEINNENTKDNIVYVKKLLKKYGLEDFTTHHPSSLSGGMRQRVSLIRTLATKPDILLLDEPFSALDYQSRLAISDDIHKILKEEHKSMIMVTHDIAEAISICNTIVVLSKRPSYIKNIYTVDLPNIKPTERRKDINFSKYYDLIWRDIDHEL